MTFLGHPVVSISKGHGLDPSMYWIGLGLEKLTHVQLWF